MASEEEQLNLECDNRMQPEDRAVELPIYLCCLSTLLLIMFKHIFLGCSGRSAIQESICINCPAGGLVGLQGVPPAPPPIFYVRFH